MFGVVAVLLVRVDVVGALRAKRAFSRLDSGVAGRVDWRHNDAHQSSRAMSEVSYRHCTCPNLSAGVSAVRDDSQSVVPELRQFELLSMKRC